ncbi:MAG TPA: DUF4129 domain-containing protein [Gemmatimonadaceae bacterium]|jgi:uncharacterized protein DUF4129|nr:DUF4129 domain-containing protein [Gemmatimonadaceae bacterium]
MPAILQQVIGGWTARQIHDTVAAIARQPEFAVPIRRSLLGRFLRWLLTRIADLIAMLGGSRGARITVIAAVAAIVIAIVGRLIITRQVELRRRTGASLRAIGSERQDYWALANELAAEGNALGACHAVYLAVVAALARDGALIFHASKTPGDYAREVRQRRPDVAEDFRSFVREFETAAFGPTMPVLATYAGLRQNAERVVARRVAA